MKQASASPTAAKKLPVNQNPALPAATRGQDLFLKRMTLSEKADPLVDARGDLDATKAKKYSGPGRGLRQETKDAGAAGLFDEFNPAGKLPITIPRLGGSVPRPALTSNGFQKNVLQFRESRTVVLDIRPESPAFHDINLKYPVEPGAFEIMVGISSRDQHLQQTISTVTQ